MPKVTEVPNMKVLQIAAAMLAISCCACSYLRWQPPDKSTYPMVRELASAQQKLRVADEASPHVLLTEIGRVVYEDFESPVWYVVYRPFTPELKRVLILAGIQGDATAGVECLLELIGDLSTSSPVAAAYDLDLLPIVNPWGYVFNLPFNRNGVEIGRDFSTFDSAEARLVRRFLREKQYDLVIDLREDPDAAGFFIWQYGPTEKNASAQVVSRIRSSEFPVESDAGLIMLRPRERNRCDPHVGAEVLAPVTPADPRRIRPPKREQRGIYDRNSPTGAAGGPNGHATHGHRDAA